MNKVSKSINKKVELKYKSKVPHIIKYMGSKRRLLNFLGESINEIYNGEIICDLFAGTAVLSGSIGSSTSIISNDIQSYSTVFAKTYLGNYKWSEYPGIIDEIIEKATNYVENVNKLYPSLVFEYDFSLDLNEFNALEQQQQDLIYYDFDDLDHHLFIKNYSGTYWSYEQCLWIDALRVIAEDYIKTPIYYPILSSLMFAMAYNAQSTGHYAQYRDAHNTASMNDIIIYRCKEIIPYFRKKLEELIAFTGENDLNHTVTTLDYKDCIETLPQGTLIYADPPYTFVHYSRFYHALETLVKYDYPNVLFKGRYRTDRHQSPFCKRTEVKQAFVDLFRLTSRKESKLILSYSNSGMISLQEIIDVANETMGENYYIRTKKLDYKHSTMGRVDDKSRKVKEYLIIATPQ